MNRFIAVLLIVMLACAAPANAMGRGGGGGGRPAGGGGRPEGGGGGGGGFNFKSDYSGQAKPAAPNRGGGANINGGNRGGNTNMNGGNRGSTNVNGGNRNNTNVNGGNRNNTNVSGNGNTINRGGNTNINVSGNTVNRTVVANPVYGGPAWGWNHGTAWYPAPAYWGGGFWGAMAIGVTSAAVFGTIVNSTTKTTYTSYQVQSNSPGATLLSNYQLTQVQCGPPNLVVIYGPNNSVICANPNQLVAAGQYNLDTSTLSLTNA